MAMPSDYISGYENACAIDAQMASNYVAHTLVGDPAADELVASLASRQPEESARLVRTAMNDPDDPALRGAPSISGAGGSRLLPAGCLARLGF